MITALDTNVLLDVWVSDPVFGESSRLALMAADARGSLVICEVVTPSSRRVLPRQLLLTAGSTS